MIQAKIKVGFAVIRPQFLILSMILILYGSGVAYYCGYFNPIVSLIALIGLISLHISANVFNEYYDFKTGTDLYTIKTPFSGGSGILPDGKLAPKTVYMIGVLCSLVGIVIGIYFLRTKGLLLLPILIIGGICVLFYTPYLTRLGLGELSAGMGLGILPILGSYFVITGHYSLTAIIASIPAGILTASLLLLNEFPDYEPDKRTGRKNLLILLGKSESLGLYKLMVFSVYIYITIAILTELMPVTTAIALITIPIAVQAIRLSQKYYNQPVQLIPALDKNVKWVLSTQTLIAIGYVLGNLLSK